MFPAATHKYNLLNTQNWLKTWNYGAFQFTKQTWRGTQHGQWKTNGKTAASADWWFYEEPFFKIELSKYILGSFVIRKWSRQDLWAIFTKFILSFQFSLSYLNSSCFQKIYHILHYILPHHLLPISNFQIGHKMLMAKVDLTCTMAALRILSISMKLPPEFYLKGICTINMMWA